MEESYKNIIFDNYSKFLDEFEDFLKPREFKSVNLKSESHEIKTWAYRNLHEQCNRFHIYETAKGEFCTIYFAKLSTLQIKRPSEQKEIDFLKYLKPDLYSNYAMAYYYYLYKTKFDTLKLFNKEMIINSKIVCHISCIIQCFKRGDHRLDYIDKYITELTKFIEKFYEPNGEGMKKAKNHFSNLAGALETKD